MIKFCPMRKVKTKIMLFKAVITLPFILNEVKGEIVSGSWKKVFMEAADINLDIQLPFETSDKNGAVRHCMLAKNCMLICSVDNIYKYSSQVIQPEYYERSVTTFYHCWTRVDCELSFIYQM